MNQISIFGRLSISHKILSVRQPNLSSQISKLKKKNIICLQDTNARPQRGCPEKIIIVTISMLSHFNTYFNVSSFWQNNIVNNLTNYFFFIFKEKNVILNEHC